MELDETGTHARLKTLREQVIEPQIAAYHGRIVKLMGDGVLAEFPSVVDALACAVDVQRAVVTRNTDITEDQQISFRIGINLGDIIVEGDDIYSDGVNIAARLESLAEPGGIYISGTAYDQVRNKLGVGLQALGERTVKNIAEPVRVYRVMLDSDSESASDKPVTSKQRQSKTSPTRRWAAVAVLAAIVLGAGAATWFLKSDVFPSLIATSTNALDKNQIAVLLFANLSADPDSEYFSDGMTEELISKLSRVKELAVIARTSVMSYKGSDKKINEIEQELQVGIILEGSVRKAADKLRITVQLIDVASQQHLWSQDYDRTLNDVFVIQSDVAQSVADSLQVALKPSEKQQLEEQATENLEAYNLYLQGLYLFHKANEEGLSSSITYFERALQYDPHFAKAQAGIA